MFLESHPITDKNTALACEGKISDGRILNQAESLDIGYDNPLIEDANFEILPGDVIALLGSIVK